MTPPMAAFARCLPEAARRPRPSAAARLAGRCCVLAVVLAGLVALAPPATAAPTIADNFAAIVTIDAGVATAIEVLNQNPNTTGSTGTTTGTVYSSYSHGELQFNFTSPSEIVYETPFPAATGFFDWLGSSTQDGTCSDGGKTGTLWQYTPASGNVSELTLCANGNTPISYDAIFASSLDVNVVFNTFTPGVPPQSVFAVPEPASAGLMAMAVACCAKLRRRQRMSSLRVALAAFAGTAKQGSVYRRLRR